MTCNYYANLLIYSFLLPFSKWCILSSNWTIKYLNANIGSSFHLGFVQLSSCNHPSFQSSFFSFKYGCLYYQNVDFHQGVFHMESVKKGKVKNGDLFAFIDFSYI